MTNLDIIVTTLSEVTGIPAAHFRGNIMRGMAASGQDMSNSELLRELTDEEANKHLAALTTPESKRGILRWVVDAGVAAHATPAQRYRIKTYMNNMQN